MSETSVAWSPRRLASRPIVTTALPAAIVGYAYVALVVARWWVSGLAAPVVALLLWTRHGRARFSAYVFLSIVVLRGVFAHSWKVGAFAALALLAMQTPGALAAWPRLTSRAVDTGPRPGLE